MWQCVQKRVCSPSLAMLRSPVGSRGAGNFRPAVELESAGRGRVNEREVFWGGKWPQLAGSSLTVELLLSDKVKLLWGPCLLTELNTHPAANTIRVHLKGSFMNSTIDVFFSGRVSSRWWWRWCWWRPRWSLSVKDVQFCCLQEQAAKSVFLGQSSFMTSVLMDPELKKRGGMLC